MANSKKVDSVKVRMYRHGFGDCFLLSFFSGDERIYTMLIDCGIKYNTKSETAPVSEVIADLNKTLTPDGAPDPKLDVLVVTHEHWDHVAFFHPTRGGTKNCFKDFDIGQIWLAWTENPDDKEAKIINSRLREGVAALGFAVEQLNHVKKDEVEQTTDLYFGMEAGEAREKFSESLDNILSFYGAAPTSKKEVSESGIKYKKNGRISSLTQEAMENVANRFGRNSGVVKFFQPGTLVDKQLIPDGINIFVLGPPRNKMINKSNPSSGHNHETYLGIDGFGMSSFVDAALAIKANAGGAKLEDSSPFGEGVGLNAKDAKKDRFFKNTYFEAKEGYRKIENTWLDITGQFALQLDGAINNTSLVLAIELAESGKVLLFPGDAQVGSWLSWHEYEWQVDLGKDSEGHPITKTYKAEDLLNKTVLYKVSHHGSHNATITDKGLEMMTHPELVAMIPEKEDSYNGILYKPLMKRLGELCKGRVIVSADKGHDPKDLKKKRPANLSSSEWSEFKQNLVVNPIYVEYSVVD